MPSVVEIQLGGEPLLLLPGRAALRPATGELFVADVHLGKAEAFRRAGRPLPHGTTQAELRRLSTLLHAHRVTRLTVLGDLIHDTLDPDGTTVHQLDMWLREHASVNPRLVLGNHDRHARNLLRRLPIELAVEPLAVPGPWSLRHHPPPVGDGDPAPGDSLREGELPWLAGHVHPGVRLRARADTLRLPVFWQRRGGVVLPAFGAFTGLFDIRPESGDQLFAAGDTEVVPVPVS